MLPIFHSGVDEAVLDCQLDDKESRRRMRRPESGRNASLTAYLVRVSHAQENKEDAHSPVPFVAESCRPTSKSRQYLSKTHMNIEAPTTHLKVDPILPHHRN